MAEVGRVKVDLGDLTAALARLDEATRGRALSGAAMAGGLVVEGAAKMNIIEYDFIDTGATLNSTQARDGGTDGEVEIGPATEYAIFGELGLGGQSEKPFMRRALEENQREIAQVVADELREAIRRAVG